MSGGREQGMARRVLVNATVVATQATAERIYVFFGVERFCEQVDAKVSRSGSEPGQKARVRRQGVVDGCETECPLNDPALARAGRRGPWRPGERGYARAYVEGCDELEGRAILDGERAG